MTTIDTRAETGAGLGADSPTARAVSDGASWITTADHKRLGRVFVALSLLAAIGLAVVGAVLGFERMQPDDAALDAGSMEQLFSLVRVGTAYFVVAPLLLGIAIAVVPLQLGARSLAFPRLAALGLWTWLAGVVLCVVAYANNGGPGGGEQNMVDLFLMGLAVTAIGLIAAAGAVVVSVLTTRAPGMTLRRVPIFSWSALVGATGLVIVLPVAVGVLILLTVDHRYPRTGFGGNKGIADWMGWAVSQPATFVLVVMVLGIVAEIATVSIRRPLPGRGAAMVGVGVFGTAMLGAVTQRQHVLPWGGAFFHDLTDKIGDLLPYLMFNVLPVLGVLVVLGVVIRSLVGGRPAIRASLLFAVLGACMLLAGAAAHVLYPIVDLDLLGTVYEEGVFTAISYGGVLAALGAMVHWWPKLTGRLLPNATLLPLAPLGVAAAALASFPLLLAGFHGQPAGAAGGFDHDLAPELLNTLVMVGHGLLALTVLAVGALALAARRSGEAAGDDPWDAATLEWATSSPPPVNNFTDLHTVASATPLADLKPRRDA